MQDNLQMKNTQSVNKLNIAEPNKNQAERNYLNRSSKIFFQLLPYQITRTPQISKDIEKLQNIKKETTKSFESGLKNRMKLKDYLHLNSIQKRTNRQNTSTENSMNKKKGIKSSQKNQTSKITEGTGIQELIKSQILKRIDEQRNRLNQFETFFQKDYQKSTNKNENLIFLFSLVNNLKQIERINRNSGLKIVEMQSKRRKIEKNKQASKYFWNVDAQRRESPAKMMDLALRTTFNITQLINICQD